MQLHRGSRHALALFGVAVMCTCLAACGRVSPLPCSTRPMFRSALEEAVAALESDQLTAVFARIVVTNVTHVADPPSLAGNDGSEVLRDALGAARAYTLTSNEVAVCRSRRRRSATVAFEGAHDGPIQLVCARERSHAQWSGTFAHELTHRAGYGHPGNSRAGNECTAPYLVGDAVEMFLGGTPVGTVCPALSTAWEAHNNQ